MHNTEPPPAATVDHHDKIHAAGVSGACCTVRERSGLVVGVSPALPIADADRTVGPARIRIRTGKNRTQQSCDCSSTAFHKRIPHRPNGEHIDLCNRCLFGALQEGRNFSRGKRKNWPAGGPTADARSLSSLPDHSAHRLARPYVPVPSGHFAWISRGTLNT